MGTLLSKDYDGDPYIDLMRSLPERELIWWVQKVIWMAEGYTFLEHFGRTYHTLFQDKCHHCNGAGIVTCPHCNGYKTKTVRPKTFRLSSMTTLANVYGMPAQQDCEHCGGYCEWDKEKEWEGKWMKWEKTLSYYDRTYGALLDEWYEDVVNDGNLEMDTPHEEMDPPGPDDTDSWADAQREVAGMPKRMEALMKRFGGHPYERGDVLQASMADPEKPALESIRALGYNGKELPPELNPQAFPELLLMGANNPIRQLDMEIRKEAMIMSNLEAAVKDQPKPYLFEPTAGTVPCPNCQGRPWFYRMTPNIAKLTFQDNPMWHRTLASMNPFSQEQGPEQAALAAGSSGRVYCEYPQASSLTASTLDFGLDGDAWSWAGPEGVRNLHYKQYMAAKQRLRDRQPYWIQDFGSRVGVSSDLVEEGAAAGGLWGSSDPLSESPERALDKSFQLQAEYNRDPVTGYAPGEHAAWAASQTPGKQVARRVRDLRLLDQARTPEEEKEVWRYLQQRQGLRQELQQPLEMQVQAEDTVGGVRPAA